MEGRKPSTPEEFRRIYKEIHTIESRIKFSEPSFSRSMDVKKLVELYGALGTNIDASAKANEWDSNSPAGIGSYVMGYAHEDKTAGLGNSARMTSGYEGFSVVLSDKVIDFSSEKGLRAHVKDGQLDIFDASTTHGWDPRKSFEKEYAGRGGTEVIYRPNERNKAVLLKVIASNPEVVKGLDMLTLATFYSEIIETYTTAVKNNASIGKWMTPEGFAENEAAYLEIMKKVVMDKMKEFDEANRIKEANNKNLPENHQETVYSLDEEQRRKAQAQIGSLGQGEVELGGEE